MSLLLVPVVVAEDGVVAVAAVLALEAVHRECIRFILSAVADIFQHREKAR